MFTCERNPKSIYGKKDRIIVVGDLHGDFQNTLALFKNLKLINDNLDWIAMPKNTFVVQLGDQMDGGGRGTGNAKGELNLIYFMEEINKKANIQGGAVLSLIGNHEIMNLIGDFRFASKEDINEVGGLNIRRKIMKPGGQLFNELSCSRNVVVKIGSWVFVHAGILPKHVYQFNREENNVNESEGGEKWFNSINNLMRLFMQGKKTQFDPEIQKLFLSQDGLIWDRNYGSANPNCKKWNATKKLLGVDNIVIGHTVQNAINSKCDDSIWRIDVGISRIFNGANALQVLEILDNGQALPKNKFKPIRVIY